MSPSLRSSGPERKQTPPGRSRGLTPTQARKEGLWWERREEGLWAGVRTETRELTRTGTHGRHVGSNTGISQTARSCAHLPPGQPRARPSTPPGCGPGLVLCTSQPSTDTGFLMGHVKAPWRGVCPQPAPGHSWPQHSPSTAKGMRRLSLAPR